MAARTIELLTGDDVPGESAMDSNQVLRIDAERIPRRTDALVGHIRAFCGDAAQNDDVTMVVIRFR